jgi:phosphatidylglycerol:prolipoprotein diacylglycerol transferase
MKLTYSALMAISVTTGFVLSRRTQATLPLSRTERFGIALGAFCGAMIGAKLPFALADFWGLMSGAVWLSDGKTIMAGLVGGYVGVELAKWALEIRIKTGDTFAVPVAAAIAVGRLACFNVGCCYGTETALPWGIDFGDGLRRHPTQLYESLFHLTAAIVLWQLGRRHMFSGHLIKLYIISYLVYRFATEFIRPEPKLWQGLTGYQWAALLLLSAFGWLWYRDSRKSCFPA